MVQSIKGGVGKTTTTIHLAALLRSAYPEARVLVVDCDQQACLRSYFRVPLEKGDLYDFLINRHPLESCTETISISRDGNQNIDLLMASKRLADVDIQLATRPRREEALKFRFREERVNEKYDFVLFDCPPSLNLLTYNVTLVGDYILIPCNMDFLSLMGVQAIQENLEMIGQYFSDLPKVLGIIPTFFDSRTNVSDVVLSQLKQVFGKKYPIFEPIRVDTNLKKAQIRKETLFEFSPHSRAAEDYRSMFRSMGPTICKEQPKRKLNRLVPSPGNETRQ